MITTKEQLKEFLVQDAKACNHTGIKPRFLGDEIWKFQYCFRNLDYQMNRTRKSVFSAIPKVYWRLMYHRLSIKLNFTISDEVQIGKGFSIAHYGNVLIPSTSIIGDNFRIHDGVCIGATNGGSKTAIIGNNVFIATGAKIIGDVCIADDVAIGANAVVVKDIDTPGTTWGGVPAKLISYNNSHANLSPLLFDDDR